MRSVLRVFGRWDVLWTLLSLLLPPSSCQLMWQLTRMRHHSLLCSLFSAGSCASLLLCYFTMCQPGTKLIFKLNPWLFCCVVLCDTVCVYLQWLEREKLVLGVVLSSHLEDVNNTLSSWLFFFPTLALSPFLSLFLSSLSSLTLLPYIHYSC